MTTNDIVLFRRNDMDITATEEATKLINAALDKSAFISTVINAAENEKAVDAQRELKTVLKLIEDARKQTKEPVIELGRRIDAVAKQLKQDLEADELRVSRLIGDYQTLQLQRQRAAEAARNAELEKIERERQEALSKAESHDEIDRIQEEFNNAAQYVPKPAPVRASGQVVKEDWLVEVTDIWSLARAHPACVKIEPRLSDIKQLLSMGVKVAGVRATKTVKAGVRVGPSVTLEVGS